MVRDAQGTPRWRLVYALSTDPYEVPQLLHAGPPGYLGRISDLRTRAVRLTIVTPESTSVPLGNTITASRWAQILQRLGHEVDIRGKWDGSDCDLLIALHALRSEASIEEFHRIHPQKPVIVALTGTDLYRDLQKPDSSRRSLALATRVVTLQQAALNDLDSETRAKTRVIYQSAIPPARAPELSKEHFDVCVLSHLRAVKDPLRAAYAARLLPAHSRIRVTHAGRVLEPEWEEKAKAEETTNPRYRWIGEQEHAAAMELLSGSRILVLSSTMEGGASAIAEAVVCGVPVLCSDIPGNVGMLDASYPGFFPVFDTQHLAGLLQRAESDTAFFAELRRGVENVRYRFAPEQEVAAWAGLIAEL